jgi:hypothetical protein
MNDQGSVAQVDYCRAMAMIIAENHCRDDNLAGSSNMAPN